MEGIQTLRDTVQKIAAQANGRDAKLPNQFSGQMYAGDFLTLIMGLPVDSTDYVALQDSLTGELLYVTDGNPIDGLGIG